MHDAHVLNYRPPPEVFQVFDLPNHGEAVIGMDEVEALLSGRWDDAYGAIGAWDIIGQQNGVEVPDPAGAALTQTQTNARAQQIAALSAKLNELRQIDPNAVAVAQRQLTTRRRQTLGFTPAIDVQPGDPFELRAEIQEVFRLERLIIPSEIAPFVVITDAKVGTISQFANNAPIPASMFSEVSTFTNVDWRTANLGNDIVLVCLNIGAQAIDVYAGAVGTTAIGM